MPVPRSEAEVYSVPGPWLVHAIVLMLTALMPVSLFETALDNCFFTNLSSYTFTDAETFVVAHGLNFVPTRKPPTRDALRQDFATFSRRVFCHDYFACNNIPPKEDAPPPGRERFRIPNPAFHPENIADWEPSPGVTEYVYNTLADVFNAADEALRHHKAKPVYNLSRRHREALRQLKLRRDIVFVDTDKNLGIACLGLYRTRI
eukprot:SAG11_NODE_605_length_8236_cov_3.988571_5_plen_204_part_00